MDSQIRTQAMLADLRIVLVIPGCSGLAGLGTALQSSGAACITLDQPQDFSDLSATEAALARADAELGGVDVVVMAVGSAQSCEVNTFTSLSPEAWKTACLDPLRTSRHCLQAAGRLFAGRGLSIALLGPNLSLTGAAGLSALSVLSEAQRALMKSAARQLGGQGIRLNWLGLDAVVFAPALAAATLPQSPEMGPPPPALGYVPQLASGVVQSIAMLAGPSPVTGASIPVDGGLWMVP